MNSSRVYKSVLQKMGRSKKLFYDETEKKGLSQARNSATDRMIKKIKVHGMVTGHKAN